MVMNLMMMMGRSLILIVILLLSSSCGPILGAKKMFFPSGGENGVSVSVSTPSSATSNAGACKLLVEKHNYPCEEHTNVDGFQVTTEDGFILSVQRIPNGQSKSEVIDPKIKQLASEQPKPALESEAKPVVLLQHGVLVDGGVWLLSGPSKALGFILADSGFDVWIVNMRGTKYSLRHTSLEPDDKEFWDWSWDALVEHEFSATLQYVHNQTAQKVHYVGHSMGTLIALGAHSNQQQMDLIRSTALLAPIGYLSNITSMLAKVAANMFLAEASYWLGMRIYDPLGEPTTNFLKKACSRPGIDCSNLLTALTGENCCLNASTVALFFDHGPQPTSTKLMIHLSQNIRDGKITKYDYGSEKENMKQYGQSTAPIYNITTISNDLPMFLANGGADALSDIKDVELLLGNLKSHDQDKLVHVCTEDYAHGDYVFADNAKEAVYDPLIKFLRSN